MAGVGGENKGAVNGGECHDLKSLLAADERDFLVRNNGDQVKIANLKGKTVGLYFSASWCGPCRQFTPKLIETYGELSSEGKDFEAVFVSGDRNEDSFNGYFSKMPWLAIPFSDCKSRDRLNELFKVRSIPHLVMLDARGEVLNEEGVEAVGEYGSKGYPFTLEKINKLKEDEEAAKRAQTLQTVLVSGELDYVIGKDGAKVPVSELIGKNILLYFSAQWCGPCRAFLPKLIEEYNKIKDKDSAFEVVFISSDRDQNSFEDFFSGMPWLALPFGDERKKSLSCIFKIRGIPSLVAIGPTGKTVTTDAKHLLMIHGADAYPFTAERIKELEDQLEEMAKGWHEKLKHDLHKEHELVLTRCGEYGCDGCDGLGAKWSYRCTECNFDLHPRCALVENKEKTGEDHGEEQPKEGYVCDGDVCRKD